MKLQKSAYVLLPALLAACTVGPDYTPPTIGLAPGFVEGDSASVGDVAQQAWWRSFNDARLNGLVDRGLKQNIDIKTAISRIAQAQATVRSTGLNSLVSGGVSGSVTRAGTEDVSTVTTTSTGSFSPSVILDLFGGERRSRESALASLQSAELSLGETRLAYLSSLVSNYIDARYYQEALAITRQNVESYRETLSLVNSQREAGAATDLDLAQAQASLDSSRASLPSLEAGFYGAVYAIATLLAEPAQGLVDQMERGAAQPRPRGNASAGVPADLLRNRPDVRAAERDLAAATADVGVSEAELYPSLSLGGTVSTSEGVNSWSFGPSLSLPVLTQGALRASRDQSIELAKQAELTWRASVLAAVEDVQTAQTSYLRSRRAVSARQSSVNSYTRVVDLSGETYRGGTTTLLDLLDSQRSLASAELSLASAVQDMAANWAQLQIAAGRGWALGGVPETN